MTLDISPSSRIRLDDVDRGRYIVTTAASEYLIDLDTRTVVRTPVSADAAALRRDATEYALVSLMSCHLGEALVMLATGIADSDDVATLRISTPVTGIEPVAY